MNTYDGIDGLRQIPPGAVMSIGNLLKSGVDYVVLGRSIRDAQQPRAVAEQVQREIALALR